MCRSSMILEIRNLHARVENQEVLKGVELTIKKGKVHALIGPNGSGKTSLAHVVLGDTKYEITKGKISFQGKIINALPPEERVKLGIALAFQHPPSIKGVTLDHLLNVIVRKETDIGPLPRVVKKLLLREVNVGFSGGEKKLSELLQILSLKPKLAILDEVDTGLDIKNLDKVVKIIKQELIKKGTSILVITHSGRILASLKPDITSVMLDGRIVWSSRDYKKVTNTIHKYGYKKFK